jgi:hypothetical protein
MKRIARAKSKAIRLLLVKLEQHEGPINSEYLKLADLLTVLMGLERRVKFSSGGHTGRPEDTRSNREKALDHMSPEKRKSMKVIWAAEDEERAAKQAQADQAQPGGEQHE